MTTQPVSLWDQDAAALHPTAIVEWCETQGLDATMIPAASVCAHRADDGTLVLSYREFVLEPQRVLQPDDTYAKTEVLTKVVTNLPQVMA